MASGGYGPVIRQVGRLLEGGGTAVALGEGQLLRRFALDRDEAAFEALVSRHGPMVLGTCRRMLADPFDVEDAFQATFLVLARRAGSIQDGDRLGPWLHGVARRVATRSRALSARRNARERPGLEDQAVPEAETPEDLEIRSALDEELARLPEKYRAPLVLCYLEGLTHDEAARQLSWPVGTVRSRLAGGRDRLRSRLTRRGLAPSAAVPGLLPAALPAHLVNITVRIATLAGSAPAHVASLARGALVAMMWNKLKAVAAARPGGRADRRGGGGAGPAGRGRQGRRPGSGPGEVHPAAVHPAACLQGRPRYRQEGGPPAPGRIESRPDGVRPAREDGGHPNASRPGRGRPSHTRLESDHQAGPGPEATRQARPRRYASESGGTTISEHTTGTEVEGRWRLKGTSTRQSPGRTPRLPSRRLRHPRHPLGPRTRSHRRSRPRAALGLGLRTRSHRPPSPQ